MKKIVVTGATSMIGIALIEECIKNNVEVLAVVREKSPHMDRLPKSEYIQICECNLDKLTTIERTEKYDVFYHFAWDYTSKANRDNPVLQEKNIKYTLDAVELAKKLGCHKFIGAGSQAEYGKVDGIINQNTAVNPEIAYGMSKYAAGKLSERMCDQYGITHIWGRIFSVYGNYDNEGTMLVYAIDQFLAKNPAKFSAATQMWDYLHENDAGKIFYLLGKNIEKNYVYRIANGNQKRLKEFILELKDVFGAGAECEFAEGAESNNLLGLQVDVSDLEKDIGYIPQTSFQEGIKNMIEYRKMLYKR